jgi:hypothetical protein
MVCGTQQPLTHLLPMLLVRLNSPPQTVHQTHQCRMESADDLNCIRRQTKTKCTQSKVRPPADLLNNFAISVSWGCHAQQVPNGDRQHNTCAVQCSMRNLYTFQQTLYKYHIYLTPSPATDTPCGRTANASGTSRASQLEDNTSPSTVAQTLPS